MEPRGRCDTSLGKTAIVREGLIRSSIIPLVLASAVLGSACASARRPASSAGESLPQRPEVVTGQATAFPTRESLLGQDKVRHFFMAAFIESVGFAGLRAAGVQRNTAMAGAIGGTAAVALGREVYDRRTKGNFSVPDLVWDAFGAGAAILVLRRTQD